MAGMFTRMYNAAAAAAFEVRSSLENPQTPLSYPAEWLLDIFNGGRTDSGIRVSEMTALQTGTVFACVNIISGAFASLPLHVMERLEHKGRLAKKVSYGHSLWDLLHNEPNPEMTSFTLFKTAMCHDLLWGNAYIEISRSKVDNHITGLWPRNPSRTRPIRLLQAALLEGDLLPMGTLVYETTEHLMGGADHPSATENPEMNLGKRRIVLAEDMIHVPGLSLDGRLGQSVVYLARQIIGLALATEKYGAKFFGNGARPAGILTLPSKIEEKAIENLRRSWAEAHGGENQFKVAVLEQGVKFEKIAATPEEGQMLATRAYQRSDLCAIFNVPQHMIAGSDKGGGKSNVEQSSIEFVLYCLNPWITAWQLELERKLFPKVGRSASKFFPLFDTRRLMYPDADSRAKFYASGRQWGYLTKNDIRELEDLNPDDSAAGDIYTIQVNMQSDAALVPGGAADGAKPELPPTVKPAKGSAGGAGNAPGAGGGNKAAGKNRPGKAAKKAARSIVLTSTDEDKDIYLARHGRTALTGTAFPYLDTPLDDAGKGEAADAGKYLAAQGIKRVVCGSLERQKQTAQIISAACGNVPVEIDEGFNDWNRGVYAGKPHDQYIDEVQWYVDHPEEVIPGGESYLAAMQRSMAALGKVRALNNLTGPTAVVTSKPVLDTVNAATESEVPIDGENTGAVYRLDAVNNLEQVYGPGLTDKLA